MKAPWRSLLPFLCLSAPAADWPQWRGPTRDGHTPEPSGWDGREWRLAAQPAWSADTGEGGSSPVILQGRVYNQGWAGGRDRVACLDAATGREVWSKEYAAPRHGRKAVGDEGLYAGPSSTPTADAASGQLFTLGVDGDLRAWRLADGEPGWQLNLHERYDPPRRDKIGRSQQRDYGFPGAPLVRDGQVIVEVGAAQGTVMAFDVKDGRRLWASAYAGQAGHTGGPALLTVGGRPCLAVLTLRELVVMRLDAGHEGETVATVPWTTEWANNIVSPVVLDDSVIVTSKYNQKAIARWKIRPDGVENLWKTPGADSGVCTPVVAGGRLVWFTREAFCLDAADGRVIWRGGAFGDAGSCLVAGDGLVIGWAEQGRLALVDPAVESYRELAARDLRGGSDVWPHLALAGGRLYLKDRAGRLRCFPVGP